MSKRKSNKSEMKEAIYDIIIKAKHPWRNHPDIERVYKEIKKALFRLKLEDTEHEFFMMPSDNKKRVKVKVEIEGE